MSANIIRVNNDYKIQVVEGGQITLDTGSTGSVLIPGNATVIGNLSVTGNYYITGNSIVDNVEITGDTVQNIVTNNDLNLNTSGTGVVRVQSSLAVDNDLVVSGKISVDSVNYESLVVDDNDIPNKKWVDDAIAYTLAFAQSTGVANGDTSVVTYDDSTYAGISKAVITVNGVEAANFQQNQVDIFNLRFSGSRIETTISNTDMFFSVPGTGKIYFQSDLQVDGTLTVVGGNLSITAITIDNINIDVNTIQNIGIDQDLILSTTGAGNVHVATTFVVDGNTTLNNTTIDNLDIYNSTISTNLANTDLYLTTSGTGKVHVTTDLIVDGNLGITGNLLSSNFIVDNIRIHDSTIENEVTNQDLYLTAQGTGEVHATSNLRTDGDLNVAGTAYISGNLNVSGTYYISGGTSTFDNITIAGSSITNTVTNDNLYINTTGTGSVRSTAHFVAEDGVTVGTTDLDVITINSSFANGTVLKSAKVATNTLALAAYDVDGIAYTNLITLTASNTPTLALTSTGVGTIDNMSIGATTRSTGAFTTLDANSNVTLGDADTDTITIGGSFITGTVLKSAKLDTNTLSLAAYDVDGTAYTNLITLTASNTPTLTLTSTGVGTINNMSIGATTRSTGAFTTLDANGNVTLGDADTDTITIGGSFVNGTALRSAKSLNNTLSLAAYDVNDAIYVNLITLTATNTPTLALTSTGVGTINNMSIGASTPSTGAFTTLSATGAITANTTINNQSYTTTTGTITISSGATGSLDNLAIGNVTRSSGKFTTLSANGAITIDTTTNNQSYTTTGAGTIAISSGTVGSIENMTIGNVTRAVGKFTNLSANGSVTIDTTTNNQSYTTSGVGTITISSGTTGTINNMSIGGTTRGAGAFTTLEANGNMVFGDADTDTITVGASFVTGTVLKTAKIDTNTLALAAYDVDGTAYTNLITLIASNTPTLNLVSTGVGTINNMSIGATTRSTGAFTTLEANGNMVFGDADTDTITIGGSFVNGSVLRSSKVATDTLALAAYDVDGTAYTNLITLTASNTPTLALTSTGVGTINNMSIGASTPSTGAFTTLSATGAITANTTTNNQSYTTSGAGTITITSGTAGNINNMNIGATTRGTGAFTTLDVNGNITLGDADTDTITVSGSFVNGSVLRSSKVATDTLALAAYDVDGTVYTNLITLTASNSPTLALTSSGVGTINNMSIGASTPATGSFTSLTATSRASGGVLSTSAGKTGVTALTLSGTAQSFGTTLAGQTLATGQVYRVRAMGTLAAISSANVRQVQFTCAWGATALTALTSGNVLVNTAQTTSWNIEFILTASSATAIWTIGQLSSRFASATALANDSVTPASTGTLTSASTLDIRAISSGTATADVLNVHSVTIERLV